METTKKKKKGGTSKIAAIKNQITSDIAKAEKVKKKKINANHRERYEVIAKVKRKDKRAEKLLEHLEGKIPPSSKKGKNGLYHAKTDGVLFIRAVPPIVKHEFKIFCAKRKRTMTEVIIRLMRDCIKGTLDVRRRDGLKDLTAAALKEHSAEKKKKKKESLGIEA